MTIDKEKNIPGIRCWRSAYEFDISGSCVVWVPFMAAIINFPLCNFSS
jgi:hypothetical protein